VSRTAHALQVHASLYRDLLALLQREAAAGYLNPCVALAPRFFNEPQPAGQIKPRPMPRELHDFRQNF